MASISSRRTATHMFTSHALLTLAIASGLSFALITDAGAQHAGRHAELGVSASEAPSVAAFKAAHNRMMSSMDVPYTGDPDVDFRRHMIPHHQGAIEMAEVAMRHAKNPWTRQLAEAVIVEQQREIAEMQAWLAQHGVAVPRAGERQRLITSSSYRQHTEEAGTLDEKRGQSWAPGSGVPARQ